MWHRDKLIEIDFPGKLHSPFVILKAVRCACISFTKADKTLENCR